MSKQPTMWVNHVLRVSWMDRFLILMCAISNLIFALR